MPVRGGQYPVGCRICSAKAGWCAVWARSPVHVANAMKRRAHRVRPPVQATSANALRWPRSRLPSRR
eukprot:179020-Alexandrium_andersonii.AAC.1